MRRILVTGAAGFIGSHLVDRLLVWPGIERVVGYDSLTYAGSLLNLSAAQRDPRFRFLRGDLCSRRDLLHAMRTDDVDTVFNLAAETHVDRSIDGPADFVRTNVVGVHSLLEALRIHTYDHRPCRLVQVSTDEVYGALGPEGRFTEFTPFSPNSPYSATKAGGDHLVRAYARTYGLDTVVTHCSNNYGPRQLPEKLIPLTVLSASRGDPIPIYGDGLQVRDWIHVMDHCEGLIAAATRGTSGGTYNMGGDEELTNLEVVGSLCDVMDHLRPTRGPHYSLVRHVEDRLGHDRRYSVDVSKAASELDWSPRRNFHDHIAATVTWYLSHPHWLTEAAGRSQ